MSVNFTVVAGTLDATVVDDNFEQLEIQLREQLGMDEFDLNLGDDKFNTFRIRRYTGGKLRNAIIGALPQLPRELMLRYGIFESNFKRTGDGPTSGTYDDTLLYAGNPRAWEVYEQQGRPGKSFFFDFQEDGFADPIFPGWPPGWWETARFADDQCWSKWLTVPHAAGKFYVDDACVAKVIGTCRGVLCFSPHYFHNIDLARADAAQQFAAGMVRLGLFADTNPILWGDEFFWANSNPTINGPYASFEKFRDMTFRASPRGDYIIVGEIPLKGRRSYNFSLKNRRANTYGYVAEVEPGQDVFFDADYEGSSLPNYDVSLSPGVYPINNRDTGISLHTLLWLGSSLNVQFNYKRNETWVNDWEDNEMNSSPTDPYPVPPYGE